MIEKRESSLHLTPKGWDAGFFSSVLRLLRFQFRFSFSLSVLPVRQGISGLLCQFCGSCIESVLFFLCQLRVAGIGVYVSGEWNVLLSGKDVTFGGAKYSMA